jgi:uncharacterized protein YjbI with pentapeptide repeats
MLPSDIQVQQWVRRWIGREDQIQEIVQALKAGKPLPDYIEKLPISEEDLKARPEPLRSMLPSEMYDLRGIPLGKQNLKGINLNYIAHFEGAFLNEANLEEAQLIQAHLEKANLMGTNLKKAVLMETYLEGAHLGEANLEGARLRDAHLEMIDAWKINLKNAFLQDVHLERARLSNANLHGADLQNAHLEEADLSKVNFEGANLWHAHLEGATLKSANLRNADLQYVHFDKRTRLADTPLQESRNYLYIRWDKDHFIGEESEMSLEMAENTYRYLKEVYKGTDKSSTFHFRENIVKTKRLWIKRKIWDRLHSLFRRIAFQWTYGYGSNRPFLRLLLSSGFVILILFTPFFILTGINIKRIPDISTSVSTHSPIHAFLHSFYSFTKGYRIVEEIVDHAFPYHLNYEPMSRFAQWLTFGESFLGLYLLFLLITVLLKLRQ